MRQALGSQSYRNPYAANDEFDDVFEHEVIVERAATSTIRGYPLSLIFYRLSRHFVPCHLLDLIYGILFEFLPTVLDRP